ncbi:tyrosine-type recombinase/integrase [Geomonas propionica]|uniref:Integrase arm-type DNA-binding domain-containing protein n=1 Tax=Geomonas propionica TaxID=2798582 RepID=A0ABS0YU63_9BACT|nr:site-specific integrase [Geomonas propionica]MBJ6801506.1 integrase arm-type DNA-binding domain-containing protein [Geomonas propionica]
MEKRKPGQFTDKEVKNYKPEAKEYWRREGQGFSLRVLPSGVKAWYYIYTFDGRKRYLPLGDGNYPEVSVAQARELCTAARVKVAKGIDPLGEKTQAALERRHTPTVADFIDEYIEGHAKRLRRGKEVERALKVEVLPRWGKRKITDITTRDIKLLRDEIAGRGAPVMANRCMSYVSGMFAYAVDKDAIKVTPYVNIKRAVKEESRERTLKADEVKQLWEALDGDGLMMSAEIKTALKLILLTAQRPGEVIGIHAKEIEGRWWTLPKERTKNGKSHRVYLTDTALSLIGSLEGREYVFPAWRGGDGCVTVGALSYAIRRNIKGQSVVTDKVKRRKGEAYKRGPYRTKQSVEGVNRIGFEMFTPHDLRRTALTLMGSEGIQYEVREKVANHTLGKLDEVYNRHDYDDFKQEAMEAIENKLHRILTGEVKKGKLISIQRRRA